MGKCLLCAKEMIIMAKKGAAPPFDFSVLEKKTELYPASVNRFGDDWVFMARDAEQDWLFASGEARRGFVGAAHKADAVSWVQAPLSGENAKALRDMFPFTSPAPVLKNDRTIGLGDRLGIATPGHIMALETYDAVPVLAQQSLREITLTGRSFSSVLDAASFGVFRAGYIKGFGADGDHLKTAAEVREALDLGYTMITLDCSEHIRDGVDTMSDSEIAQTTKLPRELEELYLDKSFVQDGVVGRMTIELLRRNYLKYGAAIDFARDIYNSLIAVYRGRVDFEISLDETVTPTRPDQHFFTARELTRSGVVIDTLAPRFPGEFQKGVDYIGDVAEFETDLKRHAAIARHFGYKLSVHSGSDKFSVYDAIGRGTLDRFHLKTAGTSWLVAMQLVAEKAPGLYRDIHRFALQNFDKAREYYHVTADLNKIPDIDTISDVELSELFSQSDARQMIHITYGLILSTQAGNGSYLFRDALYALWRRYDSMYAEMLKTHIWKHMSLLYREEVV